MCIARKNRGDMRKRMSLSLSKNHGVVKGPQPLKFIPALTTHPRVASLALRAIHLLCVKTDETPEVFILYGFCRPGAKREAKHEENSKKWR